MENKHKIKSKDTREWSFLFLGSAIGAGILFIPLQAGKVSIYSTLLTIIIALIGTYIGQKLMIKMIATTKNCSSYDDAIEYHLGKYGGVILSSIFLIFLFTIIVLLGTGVNDNLAAMLHYYKITGIGLQNNSIYTLILLACLSIPLIVGEKFLLSMIEKVVSFKIIILAILVFMFIPLWKSDNIHYYTYFSFEDIGMGLITLMPVLIFGATFFPSIGSMGRYFRTEYNNLNSDELYKVTNKTNIYAMLMLSVVLIAFITSSLFALNPSSLTYAGNHNLSALAVIGMTSSTGFFADFCIFAGYLITVLAILTSYYAVIIGLIDGIASRVPYADRINRKTIIILIHILLWVWIVRNINILIFIERIISPLIVIYVFFIPFIAAYWSKKMGKHKHFVSITCLIIGIFLMIASFIAQ
ncbi:MAG TPA: hypothetical protein QF753_15335 [Victivallales bacterium]|nr:hypothetical protein [Victivallales bacterium]